MSDDLMANMPSRSGMQRVGALTSAALNRRIESPIEALFFAALRAEQKDGPLANKLVTDNAEFCFERDRDKLEARQWFQDPAVYVWCQATIGEYRVDFLFCDRRIGQHGWYVIECDGHNFHNMSKEQVAADRKRDRTLTARGFRVFRFTGSELTQDAAACAREIVRAIA